MNTKKTLAIAGCGFLGNIVADAYCAGFFKWTACGIMSETYCSGGALRAHNNNISVIIGFFNDSAEVAAIIRNISCSECFKNYAA